MNAFRTYAAVGLVALSAAVAVRCGGEELGEREQMEELRREVAELRKAVAELTKRLEGQEYQQLPRVETIVPPASRAEVRIEPPLPKNLRFPVNIERGSAAPVMLRWRERLLR